MEISIITDEIEPDAFGAIQSAVTWGVLRFELRKTGGKRIPDVPAETIRRLGELLARVGGAITAVSPGPYKKAGTLLGNDKLTGTGWWDDGDLFERYRAGALGVLSRAFDIARRLSARNVIIFTPERPDAASSRECPGRIIELLQQAADMAAQKHLGLLLENDVGLWADTGENSRRVIDRVHRKNFFANWDPANAYLAGDIPYPDGYSHLRGLIGNVHIKDAKKTTSPFVEDYEVIGEGEIDWKGQVHALRSDGYGGFLCIETHSEPHKENSHKNVTALRRILAEAEGKGSIE